MLFRSEALDYLLGTGPHASAGPLSPQLVLLDLNIPRIDGLEVLRRLRANTHGQMLPIVVLTSSREPKDIATGYKLGCNSYVRKPIAFDAFVDATRQLSDYWLRLNEFPDNPADLQEA